MVRDYVETFYLPGANRKRKLAAKTHAHTRELYATLERLQRAWPAIHVAVELVTVAPGGVVEAVVAAELGSLEPSDVTVQVWVAPLLGEAYPLDAELEGRDGAVTRYLARLTAEAGAEVAKLVARVLPSKAVLDNPYVPGLITWSD
jgi:starch phosphorylase